MTVTSPEPLVLPGTVRVVAPDLPVHVAVPDSMVHVVPVAGPEGPRGPAGPSGAETGLAGGYVHTQSSAVGTGQPVQVVHNLSYRPAGIVCKELDGNGIEYDSVTWPTASILEVFFGVPFAGTISVS